MASIWRKVRERITNGQEAAKPARHGANSRSRGVQIPKLLKLRERLLFQTLNDFSPQVIVNAELGDETMEVYERDDELDATGGAVVARIDVGRAI